MQYTVFYGSTKDITKIEKLLTKARSLSGVPSDNIGSTTDGSASGNASHLTDNCPVKRVKLETVIKQPAIAIANDVKSIVDTAAVSVTNVHPLNSYKISHKTPGMCDTINLASDLCDNGIGGCSSTTAIDCSPMKEHLTEPSMKMDASMVADNMEETWLKLHKTVLKEYDKRLLQNGERLNDHHINYAQTMLRTRFPYLEGLQLTLLQEKYQAKIKNGLQLFFVDHVNIGF